MPDHQFLRLSDRWALAADRLQWIVQKRQKHRTRGEQWNPVAFVASEKRILLRVLREKGAEITPEAQKALDAMPPTFTEWSAGRARLPSQRRTAPLDGSGLPEAA